MKKKAIVCLVVIAIFFFLLNLGFNIYFVVSREIVPSDIFVACKQSVLEIKAETEDVGESFGTGEIISSDGLVVTNAHVITYKSLGQSCVFDAISVRFVDEEEYREVCLIKYDLDLDLAVLKIDCERKINSLKIGDSGKLDFGDKVYAIGNMSNYGLSITTGIVSIPSINVKYNDYTRNVIQCDLTISDGNSGGALLDKNGKLVGITTFRLKDTSANVVYGISYCIPIKTVLEYIN